MVQESIEVSVARLDERLKGFQAIFEQMADDQRRMAESYEELVKSNGRITLVEAEVVSMKAGQAQLWKKYDGLQEKYDFMQDSISNKEIQKQMDDKKDSQKWLWEIAKIALSIAGGVIALKVFGIHI
jgi:hypothetical protein